MGRPKATRRINLTEWQGYTKKQVQKGITLIWNRREKRYRVVTEIDGKANVGIRFTYFAAQGIYYPPKGTPESLSPPEQNFYSINLFGKQLWRETDEIRSGIDELGPEYDGRIPVDVLINLLNDVLGLGDKDFRQVYTKWSFRYETGVGVRKTKTGKLKIFLDKDTKFEGKRVPIPLRRSKGDL